jgi:hypothetical protein
MFHATALVWIFWVLQPGFPVPQSDLKVRRFEGNPIIRPEMIPGEDGNNINGPSLIRVPDWVLAPLGRYYLYFAHHGGDYIRLAYADRLEGPWTVRNGGTLHLRDAPGCRDHIASPDVQIDELRKEVRMYFHGSAREGGGQKSYVAISKDGLNFSASAEELGIFYFRVWRHEGIWWAMAKGGLVYRSADGLSGFVEQPGNPFPWEDNSDRTFNRAGSVRHVAIHQEGGRHWVYYTRIGDAPERIYRSSLGQAGGRWIASQPELVLVPERGYEGASLPVVPSRAGAVRGDENAVRDPGIYTERGRVYLFYSVAGERGIGIAELVAAQ